jgi:hypothetical protein
VLRRVLGFSNVKEPELDLESSQKERINLRKFEVGLKEKEEHYVHNLRPRLSRPWIK